MSDQLIGPVDVGPVAHGGHCVARHDGRVIFVRHALPGERVMVAITDDRHDRFWRGDAVDVLEPSLDRVEAPCRIAGPGRCGGCDFQHVDLSAQRALKAAVVAEQLARLAGFAWDGVVEAVPLRQAQDGALTSSGHDGLGWRTRMRYQVDDDGRAGLHAHRSDQLVPLPDEGCRIADPRAPDVTERRWSAGSELIAVAAASGPVLLVDGRRESGTEPVVERAVDRSWTVDAGGFWQVHPAAADTLAAAVRDGLDPQPGERAFDLYCGVGLFAGMLADAGCLVWGAEESHAAIAHARRNLADASDRTWFYAYRVERALSRLRRRADLVVLDPPRSGAGKQVMHAIVDRRPRAIAYVACDPAALARDLATAQTLGYEATSIRAFDLFPMTHHVECVAILTPLTVLISQS